MSDFGWPSADNLYFHAVPVTVIIYGPVVALPRPPTPRVQAGRFANSPEYWTRALESGPATGPSPVFRPDISNSRMNCGDVHELGSVQSCAFWHLAASRAGGPDHGRAILLAGKQIDTVRCPRALDHPCFAMRVGGVSGGNETQGWRDSSHTAMVGAGKLGSPKLPMATAMYPGKPSPSQ